MLTLKMDIGQKICKNCITKIKKDLKIISTSEDSTGTEVSDNFSEAIDVNEIAKLCQISPFKSVSGRDKKTYYKRKIININKSVKRTLNFNDLEDDDSDEDKETCTSCDELIINLKAKIIGKSSSEVLKRLLTIVPKKWSLKRIKEEFGNLGI